MQLLRVPSQLAVILSAALLCPTILAAQVPAGPQCDIEAIRVRWAAEPGRVITTDGLASLVAPEGMQAPSERRSGQMTSARKIQVLALAAGEAIITVTVARGDSTNLHPGWRSVGREYARAVLPEVVWLRDEVIEIKGRRWHRSEFATPFGRGSHHAKYETWFEGRQLEVTMSASRANGPQWVSELDKTMQTLELAACSLSGDGAAPSRVDPAATQAP